MSNVCRDNIYYSGFSLSLLLREVKRGRWHSNDNDNDDDDIAGWRRWSKCRKRCLAPPRQSSCAASSASSSSLCCLFSIDCNTIAINCRLQAGLVASTSACWEASICNDLLSTCIVLFYGFLRVRLINKCLLNVLSKPMKWKLMNFLTANQGEPR